MLYKSGQIEVRPSEITYTAVLNSCAFPVARDSRSRRKALDTAMFTLAEVQSSEYCSPNEATYGTFIRACANLLHDDDKLRRDIIEKAFKQCCKDGQVGDLVLSFLRRAAPADLYEELLADISSGTLITAEDLPREWRCNVSDGQLPRSYARAFSTVVTVIGMAEVYRNEEASGSEPSSVYRMSAVGESLVRVTNTEFVNTPPGGRAVGGFRVGADWRSYVKAASQIRSGLEGLNWCTSTASMLGPWVSRPAALVRS